MNDLNPNLASGENLVNAPKPAEQSPLTPKPIEQEALEIVKNIQGEVNPDHALRSLAEGAVRVSTPEEYAAMRKERAQRKQESGSDIKEDLTQPNRELFTTLLKHVDREKLESGVYTEVHYSHGKVYVTPEIIDPKVHYATVGGQHSMWAARDITMPDLDQEVSLQLDQARISMDSLIGKGILVHNQETGKYTLTLSGRVRPKEFARIVGAETHLVNDALVIREILNQSDVIGIDKVVLDEGQEIHLEKGKVPKVVDSLDYISAPDMISPRAGVISNLTYEEGAVRIKNGLDEEVVPRADIRYSVSEGNFRLHEQVVEHFNKTDPSRFANGLISNVTLLQDGQRREYSVSGRHFMMGEGGWDGIDFMVATDGDIDIGALRNFEFSYFSSYIKELIAETEYKGHLSSLKGRDLKLTSSFSGKDNNRFLKDITIPWDDLIDPDFLDTNEGLKFLYEKLSQARVRNLQPGRTHK